MYTLTKKLVLNRLLLIPFTAFLAFSAGCSIQQETTGELPDVDVKVNPGKLPQYQIKGPDVQVKTVERTITVPRVEIVQEKKTIQVPYIDVNLPGVDSQEQTLTAEVAVPSTGYNLAIQDVYVVNNQLWVIAQLDEANPNAPKANTTVSDRLVINAPEMPVKYYIIGQNPVPNANKQYSFVDSRQAIQPQLASGQPLYHRQAG